MTMMVQTSTDEVPELLERIDTPQGQWARPLRRVVGGGVPDRDRAIS